jgi:hypothetical protein
MRLLVLSGPAPMRRLLPNGSAPLQCCKHDISQAFSKSFRIYLSGAFPSTLLAPAVLPVATNALRMRGHQQERMPDNGSATAPSLMFLLLQSAFER